MKKGDDRKIKTAVATGLAAFIAGMTKLGYDLINKLTSKDNNKGIGA